MASVLVVHPDLSEKGGAEAVCMNVLQGLQNQHSVSLLTMGDTPIAELNGFFQTNVHGLSYIQNTDIEGILHSISKYQLYKLKKVLLARHAEKMGENFDAVISTKNELQLSHPSVQYIHFPEGVSRPPGSSLSVSRSLYRKIIKHLEIDNNFEKDILLTNSHWTANIIKDTYGIVPQVLYPPVMAEDFQGNPWINRQNGFVSIGRIEQEKNIHEVLDILEQVRTSGHSVHIHLVGKISNDRYGNSVMERADTEEWIQIEGVVPRSELIRLVEDHRYGIHGRHSEHFGIAVAEFVAGGAIPFIPNSGGQVEIVQKDSRILYSTKDEAVEKIQTVLENPSLSRNIRTSLPSIRNEFGRVRFQNKIKSIFEQFLSNHT